MLIPVLLVGYCVHMRDSQMKFAADKAGTERVVREGRASKLARVMHYTARPLTSRRNSEIKNHSRFGRLIVIVTVWFANRMTTG